MEAQPSKSKWNIWRLLLFVIVFSVGLGCILVFVIKRTLPTETSSFVTVQSPDGRYSLTGRKLILSDSVYFTGFPYAEADERFSKSQLLDMYVNETATQWSEDCPSFYYRGGNEDCLSLNVYRCSSIHNLHLPVLVHINEGEPDTESTANLDPVLVIKNLACRGMIVVSVHYRHSAFSQLYFGNRAFTSNLGVSDVQAALEWVNLNIPKFHGNRSRVTVMELFSNMILVDRAYESPELFSQTSQFLIQQSQRFSTLVGCSKATDKFDETNKSKMSKTMKCAFIRAEAKMLQSWNRWPIDSTELKNAASPSMNVMLGTCHFSSPSQTEASSSFQTRLKKALQTIRDFDRVSNPNDFIEYYTTRFAGYSSLRTALKEIRKDFTELGPLLLEANKFAEVNSNGTKKTFVFDLTTNQSRSDYGNVRQMARQYPPCLEHLLFKKVPEADIKLHNFMVDSVVNFVIKSNPNSVSNDTTSLQWPEFNSIDSTRSILSVNSEGIDVVTNPWPSSLRFWLCEQSKATNSTENCAVHSNACSDFVVLLNGGNTQRSAESTRELANSLATQLELDQRVHRVALVTGIDNQDEPVDFERIKTRSDYLQVVRDWQPSPLSSTSKGLETRLEQVLRQATAHRRMNVALTVILLDDDGSSAFNTNPSAFGVFGEYVRKKHYIYVLIVSKKAERIRTSLDLSSEEVETGSNRDELRLIASPFTRCQIRLANELRRKPLPRLNKVNGNSRIVSKSDDQQTTIVNLRPVTVPVSVHFPTTTIRSTTKTTTQSTTTHVPSTTTKPRKLGCQFDVVILFDLSGNSFDKLQRYQQMTIDLIRQSELGEHAARFSLIRYSGPKRTDVLFHLNKHSNQTNLIKDIENVQVMGGTTRTKEAMEFALREFESKFGGRDRNEVQRHMIVFTDGHSQDDPADIADELNKQRVHVFAVAVDDVNIRPDLEQLRLISSDSKSALLDAQFGKVIEQLAPRRCRS